MTARTITRLLMPLRGGRPQPRITTTPRPKGWANTPDDYCRWKMYLRREGRNDPAYLDRF